MTTLNIPTISRKKKFSKEFGSESSFRIFGDHVERSSIYSRPDDKPERTITTYDKTLALPSWHYNSHYEPERNIRNRDHCTVNYLRRNVRTLNDPVCYIPSKQEAEHWWPNRVPLLEKPKPAKSHSSTMRADYQWNQEHDSCGSNRHKYNVSEKAHGAIPVNWLPHDDGKQKFYKEKISYEHQYNSRWNDNYTVRSRRHGAFVDEPISSEKAAKILENCQGWRVDTGVNPAGQTEGRAFSHLQEVQLGPLPGLTETYRRTDAPNAKIRSNYDIAPRSNLNTRIREYIPSMVTSAPTRLDQTNRTAPIVNQNKTPENKTENAAPAGTPII